MFVYDEWLNLMHQGGPLMWVIFATALIGVTLLVWQAWRLSALMRGARMDFEGLLAQRGQVELPSLTRRASPVAELILRLDWPDILNQEDLAKEMNIHFAQILPRLEGALPTIATLGALLPMLGLLGTVTGMINVFEAIALHGSGKPEHMAQGISQALLTTAGGLISAIAIVFAHHLLSRRAHTVMALTSQAMQVLLHRDLTKLKQVYGV